MRKDDLMSSLERLVTIMEKLRAPNGCPWDREQTHESLRPYVIEEAYEVVEAIDQQDPRLLADELGDLLLQVVFHAQVAEEKGSFTLDDVINAICEKLTRRHPHVFADTEVKSVDDVITNWDAIKRKEYLNERRESVLDGVPKNLSPLLKAEKIQKKAAKVGFDWPDSKGAWEKLYEEIREFEDALKVDSHQLEEEMGDILFSLVNVARFYEISPEIALNKTVNKFIFRFRYMEQKASELGVDITQLSLAQMDALWDQAKLSAEENPSP